MSGVGRSDRVRSFGGRIGVLQQESTASFWGKAGDAGLGKVRRELVEQARVGVVVEPVRVDADESRREAEGVDVDLWRTTG